MALTLYQFPLSAELVEITTPFSPALAEVPTSAVVWLERHGVTTEYPATLQPDATTALAVVTWDPSGRVLAAGSGALPIGARARLAQLLVSWRAEDYDAGRRGAALTYLPAWLLTLALTASAAPRSTPRSTHRRHPNAREHRGPAVGCARPVVHSPRA